MSSESTTALLRARALCSSLSLSRPLLTGGVSDALLLVLRSFYSIPLVRGIADGVQDGDVIGNIAKQFSAPTESLNGLGDSVNSLVP